MPNDTQDDESATVPATPAKTKSKAVCELCHTRRPILKVSPPSSESDLQYQRPKTLQKLCKECFYHVFETEIHNTIVRNNLFQPGEKIAIAASGGKDSTVLAHTMGILNKRYNYGVEFYLLSVDEGITGYRDDSLEVYLHISGFGAESRL
jgi:cytoplasmic tRNA 2-thiolation protein 1